MQAGDRVAIYMPMIPETVIAMLACARIGAVHMVVFGGFSADALASRIDDAGAVLVITSDGGYRRGAPSALKPAVDDAVGRSPGVRNVLVVKRTGQDVDWTEGRDLWWDDVVERQSTEHTPRVVRRRAPALHHVHVRDDGEAEGHPAHHRRLPDPGRLHALGDASTSSPTTDVFWTAADVGWVTGHSYIVYGPLANRATSVMYEGTPETPHRGRWWEIIEKYGVTILYTAPTVIRTFMKWGEDIPAGFDLSSLRVLGSVGEPINPEAWLWYHENIGGGRCPIVDTWWQTETGAHMITPLPGVTTLVPGSAQRPFPGISAKVVDDEGNELADDSTGLLVLTEPWPSMLRTIWGDDDRYVDTYWSRFGKNVYFAGDGAKKDADGNIWLLGRVDDVMNVSGPPHLDDRGRVLPGRPPDGGRGGGRGRQRPDHRPGHRRVRHPPRRAGRTPATSWCRRCATTSPRTSARSPSRARSWSCRSCPRPARARSCGGCCATSPRTASSATSPR